jgi:predicted lipoprotein with Yx(FWY)xxD motif
MRKSGWAAAAGLGSLALLLAACGGSSGSSGSAGSTATPTTTTAAGQATSQALNPPGTTVLIVQKSDLGYVLAEANGLVVYTYGNDKKGGSPTCTGSCASLWPPVTGNPKSLSADTLPGTLGTVSDANGAKQVTYNGYPLYTYKGAKPLTTSGNGVDGLWHVIKLSASDVSGG